MKSKDCRLVLINFLKNVIINDYILLDLPYYSNVGDVLIWQSTLDLLKEMPYKCLYSSSIESYKKPRIDNNVIILLMGGGNFGDLWIRHQHFRHNVLKDFPDNPVIQLPQSVCFNNLEFLKKDIENFCQHPGKVTICLRDANSYKFVLENYLKVDVYLLPDMVLAFEVRKYIETKIGKGVLYVKRNDLESSTSFLEEIVPKNADIRDWPTMERMLISQKIITLFLLLLNIIDDKIGMNLSNILRDLYYKTYFRVKVVKIGLKFVNLYNQVYTTRLHVGIIAALLGKPTIMFDNSYGKISGVYEQWMKDWNGLTIK